MSNNSNITNDNKLCKTIQELFYSRGLCGLVNKGNTCYMNTGVTCISNTLPLSLFFLNKNHLCELNPEAKESELVVQWCRLLEGIWEENCTISPQSFILATKKLSFKQDNIFHLSGQQDVAEYIVYLINNFHEALSKKVSINISGIIQNENDKIVMDSMTSWKKYFKDSYSIIIELFYGQYISIVQTTDNLKPEKSYTYEPFCILDLEIPNHSSDIYECLELMISESLLIDDNKWYSDDLKQYRKAKRNLMILNLPQILIISLKRFNPNGTKNMNTIEFPINDLNLEKYVFNSEKKKCNFSLFAIANHVGVTNFGHYFSYCKNINSKWYHFDDETVKEINEHKIVSNSAYCLFYQKK